VNYIATNSPAAKAGLQENDLLVEFNGQPLVHPLQLRKLVQVRKEGDTVILVVYRAGKKQTVSATLAKTVMGFGLNDMPAGQGYGGAFRQFGDLPTGDAFREQMKALREQMGKIKIDQKQVQEEIRRSMEEARKTYREAMRQATNANSALGPILEDLDRMGAAVDNDASVTVRSTGRSAKSLVKADESGTIMMVRNPKLHLTAHDKEGKLLFDGEIETPDQRARVPHDLWNRVEPLLKKMAPEDEEKR
jgi:membrane-associated protease RseP (regulator of RpoE activity)